MKKDELLEKCRQILYNSVTNYPLNETDKGFLLKLFPLHPEWKSKTGGKDIKNLIVRKHPQYKNKCFALVLEDNTIVDISFTECINKTGLKNNVVNACGKLIEDIDTKTLKAVVNNWVESYENGYYSVAIFIEGDKFTNTEIENSFKNFYNNNK